MKKSTFAGRSAPLAGAFLLFVLLLASVPPIEPTSTPEPKASPTTTATPTQEKGAPLQELRPEATPLSPEKGSPTSRPPDINPLTGLKVEDPATLQRRPIQTRIGNDPEVRPQSGLDKADLVYEDITEGWWVTRFTAVFLSQDPEVIGPVRSARLVNLELAPPFKAALVHSGASDAVRWYLAHSKILDLDEFFHPKLYHYLKGRDWKGRLFTDARKIRSHLEEEGLEEAVELPGFTFSEEPPAGAMSAREVIIPYARCCTVRYRYDQKSGRYLRFVAGKPHMNAEKTEQLSAANIIVHHAVHEETDIIEDVLGHPSINIVLVGEGYAEIFRDGVMLRAFWTRKSKDEWIQYLDAVGNPIPLKPGSTWIQLIPNDWAIHVEGRKILAGGIVAGGPPGGRIAFVSEGEKGPQICLAEADGEKLTCLTEAGSLAPAWSPDGKKLAFHTKAEKTASIYVVNADGTELKRLTDDEGDDLDPVWSPDGSHIAFRSNRGKGVFELYIMRADGTDLRLLNEGRSWSPAWSPDSKSLAFVSDRDGRPEIYLVGLDEGKAPTRLTDFQAGESDPAWSPDSRYIAFTSLQDGNSEVYVKPVEGGEVQNVSADPAYDGMPAWSPDGKNLAFVSTRRGDKDIFVVAPDGSSLKQLTTDTTNETNPVWSPDGRHIAFKVEGESGAEICLVAADGTGLTCLTDNTFDDWHPAWSP